MGRFFIVLGLMTLLAGAGSLRAARAGWGDDPASPPAEAAEPAKPAATPKYDFKLDDLHASSDVQMHELSDKPLVVHVWAPGCPLCERNMPYVKGTFTKIDRASVNFVACSMGEQRATAAYVREHELPFSVLYKGHSKDYISEAFTTDGWPTSFVFAPGGELIGSCDAQGSAYETQMLELIGEALRRVTPKDPPKKVKHWY